MLLRQIRTLTWKNILITLFRHPGSTPLRALIFPIVFAWFLSYARNLFIPPSTYGIDTPHPVRSLQNAFGAAGGGRNIVALVNNGFTGGDIEKVVNEVANVATADGKNVQILTQEDDLLVTCRNSLKGSSYCIAGIVFFSSPTEGPGGIWNYTIRADGYLGTEINVNSDSNDQEIYVIPIQHTVDFAIAGLNSTVHAALPQQVFEYPYTTETQAEREADIRTRYMSGIIQILGVAFFIAVYPVTYQLTGMMASERESQMSQLIECMMPNKRRWEPQVARLSSYHFAFTLIYLPSWIVISIIFARGVFQNTNVGILIVLNILAGLSICSWSIFGGAFFRRSQLSGIVLVIASELLAVVAQIVSGSGTGTIAILSLLFPPMNYTFFIILMARFEFQNVGTNLIKAAPDSPYSLPGIVFIIFFIIQIFAFPVLGALVERWLWGTTNSQRVLSGGDAGVAVQLTGFTKIYRPSWLIRNLPFLFRKKRKETVVAVSDLTLKVLPGQIMVLLGANGSGKSTTLDAIAGLTSVTTGNISVDGSKGIGYCPQKNVLFQECTVEENVTIFNRLKSLGNVASQAEIRDLIKACDLDRKIMARAKSLSGGQMRKLQLSMMFTGDSRVCLVDECSSGVDALARRRLQDILLTERSRSNRTIIFTTHFLDEADLLADHIAIMSKGVLRADGTAPEIKHSLGAGYRVHIYHTPGVTEAVPDFDGALRKDMYDQTIFTVPDSARAADLLERIEQQGFTEYQISGPTIEDAFMKISEEMAPVAEGAPIPSILEDGDASSEEKAPRVISNEAKEKEMQLRAGKRIGPLRQGFVLFRKRATVFRRNPLPNLLTLLIPIVAAGLASIYLKTFGGAGCSPSQQTSPSDISSLAGLYNYDLVVGPKSSLPDNALEIILSTISNGESYMNSNGPGQGVNLTALSQAFHTVDSLPEFNDYISNNYANVTPGGFYLGDDTSPPTFAYQGNGDLSLATITQNLMDIFLTNISIANQYQAFDIPWQADQGHTLQFCVYFGLALSIYTAFFALYPCVERIRNVRALHYSNGVRALPLWLAYITWDFSFVLVGAIIAVIIFRAVTDVWYNLGYLFVVLFLYGLASTLYAYVISLFAKSQLAAFAIAAGSQAAMFLLYIIAYLSTLTYAPVNKIDSYLLVVHYTVAFFFIPGNLIRALFVSLNIFSITCVGREIAPYPGDFIIYGVSITYLTIQVVFLFTFLVWYDSGYTIKGLFRRKAQKAEDAEAVDTKEGDVAEELTRVTSSNDDGLQVLNVTKAFGKNVAVEDITFGVRRGEVFALLGPNGAGKSTTISMIRGDLRPSNKNGEIFIENTSVISNRASARQYLGVCPQFDATDQMTVLEHLRFYARIRGVSDVEHNVREVIRAVGLQLFQTRLAASLSGGNKRKLSLGIALMGNPTVLLLDEPSSGMDVAAKRVMWKTLAGVVPGRSIVLTTHSMEEADALANRAGIMAKRMLALGTSDYLRKRHGNRYHVHVLMASAPYTTVEETEKVKAWVNTFPEAIVDDQSFHGQIRFSVPLAASRASPSKEYKSSTASDEISRYDDTVPLKPRTDGISALFATLERSKKDLGFEYYSVSQTTLDQVFIGIISKHNVEEEGYDATATEKRGLWRRMRR